MEKTLHPRSSKQNLFWVTNGIRVFFQKRQRVENAESYYDAGALVVLVVWKMPCAPRGKLNGKAYRIYPI